MCVKNHSFRFLALWILLAGVVAQPLSSHALEFSQEDRERMIRLETTLTLFMQHVDKRFEQIDKRFEQIDKRFEQVDKRFEQVDKRFEEVNSRFEQLTTLMAAIIGGFAAVVTITIGFALWDRRTMIRPFEQRMKPVEKQIETLMKDQDRLERLIQAMKALSEKNPEIASVLRSFALL